MKVRANNAKASDAIEDFISVSKRHKKALVKGMVRWICDELEEEMNKIVSLIKVGKVWVLYVCTRTR